MDSLEFLDDLTVAWLLLTHSSNSDIRVGDGPRSPGTHRLGAPGGARGCDSDWDCPA